MSSRVGVVAVAVAALLAGGCGGGSGGGKELTKAQYEQRVQKDAAALEQAFSAIGSNTSSLTDLQSAVADAGDGLDKAAADLASLNPPREAKAANQAFVNALRSLRKQLSSLADAAKSGDMTKLLSEVQKLSTSKEIAAAQEAANELKQKGYELGAFGN